MDDSESRCYPPLEDSREIEDDNESFATYNIEVREFLRNIPYCNELYLDVLHVLILVFSRKAAADHTIGRRAVVKTAMIPLSGRMA